MASRASAHAKEEDGVWEGGEAWREPGAHSLHNLLWQKRGSPRTEKAALASSLRSCAAGRDQRRVNDSSPSAAPHRRGEHEGAGGADQEGKQRNPQEAEEEGGGEEEEAQK